MRATVRAAGLRCLLVATLACATACAVVAADEAPPVTVHNPEMSVSSASWECTRGHEIHRRQFTFASGETSYRIKTQGCFDPSHGEQHPCNEGTFGMPSPTRANWYASGFMEVLVNGVNATLYQDEDRPPRVLETGERGVVQFVWDHPAADVGLRLMMLSGGNHLIGDLRWWPREGQTVESVTVKLLCFPSFFTAARNRTGDRHVMTPRIDKKQGERLDLVPGGDTWLYYYDTVFDVANGEGDGPCAALLAPGAVTGGRVGIGGYGVNTTVQLDPSVGEARLAFYDFTGWTNAEAERYMTEQGADDLAQLQAMSFRPALVRELDLAEFTAETQRLLEAAGVDGDALRPRVEKLLARVTELKPKADAGDWPAEAELAETLRASDDLFWKLKTFAVLNG